MGLGAWNIYFLAKFFLFWQHYISFHPLENLAFAAFLLMPIRSATGRFLRQVVALPAGVALLYYDSWLPPVARVLNQADNMKGFSSTYLVELVGRFFDVQVVAALILIWAVTRILSRYLRIGTLVTVTLASMVIWSTLKKEDVSMPAVSVTDISPAVFGAGAAAPSSAKNGDSQDSLNAVLENFYREEAKRKVNFIAPASAAAPFDVLFLHICSLSWDDLEFTGLSTHPLFDRFDLLFTNFNSASSYSGPAMVHLLRATCGQSSHHDLYQTGPGHCYLFQNLAQAGFSPQVALNHDGHFDGFLEVMREQGKLNATPLSLDGIEIVQRSFDDSPIHADLQVLNRWLEQRQQSMDPKVAAYYNTISLHDGNRLIAGPGSKLSSLKSYPQRLRTLLDDLETFLRQVEASGRQMVVVLAPEHGAALRGDRMQIAGMREIPSPAITRVPAAIAVIGPDLKRKGGQVRNDTPVSYLAISHVIQQVLQEDVFGNSSFDPARLVTNLPQTAFIAENEDTVVMRAGDQYYLRLGEEDWSKYPVAELRP
ncbi:Cellulose biosynthesis protein BcsG [hydrothermal vent metagenome]|uniref:Cellulose biosynthesis protein BcsG n=1 Tax=hydrothermal vent metagenome TaxID=652676 RepID=A0A3B1AXP6_9ZZZZ